MILKYYRICPAVARSSRRHWFRIMNRAMYLFYNDDDVCVVIHHSNINYKRRLRRYHFFVMLLGAVRIISEIRQNVIGVKR